ncbi:MAG TPA: TIM44-like domain-containing protein [Azoarcus sp.]|nr:TIM44-like domain-containing protein [Azoarcus sp.]
MKQLVISLMVALFTIGFVVPDAEARRFGGGGNFGMQRNVSPPANAPRAATPAPSRPANQAAAAGNRSWLGPVAGLAAGLGLAALFSSLGLSEEFGSLLLLGLLVFAGILLFRWLARRVVLENEATRVQYAGPSFDQHTPQHSGQSHAPTQSASDNALREQLDEAAFLRQAKLNFIRLQAANDRGDLLDIREFTTPGVFAEIRMQMADAPMGPPQRTDVIELDAQILDVTEEDERYIVSVQFSGQLREEADASPAQFNEIWHLVKNRTGADGWRVSGIQQVS